MMSREHLEESAAKEWSIEVLDGIIQRLSINNRFPFTITKHELESICFKENLIISRMNDDKNDSTSPFENNQSETVGRMTINIEKFNENLFCFSNAEFSFENSEAKSQIFAIVDRHFNLLEEKRTETIHDGDSCRVNDALISLSLS